jgi:hypothetical protein
MKESYILLSDFLLSTMHENNIVEHDFNSPLIFGPDRRGPTDPHWHLLEDHFNDSFDGICIQNLNDNQFDTLFPKIEDVCCRAQKILNMGISVSRRGRSILINIEKQLIINL